MLTTTKQHKNKGFMVVVDSNSILKENYPIKLYPIL